MLDPIPNGNLAGEAPNGDYGLSCRDGRKKNDTKVTGHPSRMPEAGLAVQPRLSAALHLGRLGHGIERTHVCAVTQTKEACAGSAECPVCALGARAT